MNIYLFERNDSYPTKWNQFIGFVVSAKDVKEARELIDGQIKDAFLTEPQDNTWFNAKLIGYKIDSKSEVILQEFLYD